MTPVTAGVSTVDPGSPVSESAVGNHLLENLASGDLAQVVAASELTRFDSDTHIAVGGERISEVYFPLSGYASLMVPNAGDASVQVAFVGREGVLGWESLLDGRAFLLDIYVPETLQALRMDVGEFCLRTAANESWRKSQFKYVAKLFTVASRGVLCARFHVLEARLARCLLEVHDRHPEMPILLTQSTLSTLLGVRRSGVTNAATHLQLLGLIQYRRGEILLIDRKGLEAAACECYRHDVRPSD